jgi:predicted permease
MREWLRRVRSLLRRARLDDDLREEIREHIALRTRQLTADGMDPREASFEARRMFGNVTSIREESREMWGFRALDTLGQDARYGARMLRRSPLVTIVAIVSLAIGIGATVAVFTLFETLLFRKLPVRAPDELVLFRWASGPVPSFESLTGYGAYTEEGYSSTSFSKVAFESLRSGLSSKAEIFGFADLYRVNLAIDGRPEKAEGQAVSGNYFTALGVVPAAGRFLAESDDRAGANPVAVISYDFWQRRLGGANALGRLLVLNGFPVTIVGVAPQGFHGTLQVGEQHDVIVPLSIYPAVAHVSDSADPNSWWVLLMGRLKPGVRAGQLQPQAEVILKQTVAAARPQQAATDLPRLLVEPGARGQVDDRNGMREPLTAMALVVAIVLLVACANVANLMLARGRARVRELAVRVAIGASRSRVIRQLLTEGLLLSAIGSALGLAFATSLAMSLLPAVGLSSSPFFHGGVDWRVLTFTVLLASASSLLFGLAPALRATDVRLAANLQDTSRSTSGLRQRGRLGNTLVILQVALSMLLVTSAALLGYSLWSLERVDPGFEPEGILLFRIDANQNGYDGQRAAVLYSTALERLAAVPGVRAATLTSHTLIAGSSAIGVARPAGMAAPHRDSADAASFARQNRAWRLTVDGAFFNTFRIPMKAGRTFGPSDSATAQPVAVINETLARRLFGTADALGRRLLVGLDADAPEMEVIGVCADAKYTSVRRESPPTLYLSYRQHPTGNATFAVAAARDPLSLVEPMREAMRQLDPALPLYDFGTQTAQIRNSLRRERLFATLAMLLGSVTLLLAAIGLYGLLAYAVARRTPEIGVRMALGAGRGTVRWMILRQSLALVITGLALGVPLAIAGSRFVESMLFGLTPTNPLAIAVAATVMLTISLAASFLPAQRAARVDPIVALRTE